MVDSSSSLPVAPRALPRRFGRYSLFDLIGKGGMAEIYLARARTELGAARLCVVKQIVPEYAHNPAFAEMLIHEAKLAARLSHANIVQVFDLGREGDQLFIAMEYIEGYDLNTLLRDCSRGGVSLPVEFALRMVTEALKGLDYAHRRRDEDGKPLGIVHRDVSPSNVLVSFDGEVKLCDFGIAHANDVAFEGENRLEDALKGKAGYMSPEHARGETLDARADVFQIGIILWELLGGRRMYRAESGVPLLEVARRAEIPELPTTGLPEEAMLRRIVGKALAVSRDERYASAAAMLKDLESYMRAARLSPSPLRFGEWLTSSFGTHIVSRRRARERASQALERGPALVITPLPPLPQSTRPSERPSAPPPASGVRPSGSNVIPKPLDGAVVAGALAPAFSFGAASAASGSRFPRPSVAAVVVVLAALVLGFTR